MVQSSDLSHLRILSGQCSKRPSNTGDHQAAPVGVFYRRSKSFAVFDQSLMCGGSSPRGEIAVVLVARSSTKWQWPWGSGSDPAAGRRLAGLEKSRHAGRFLWRPPLVRRVRHRGGGQEGLRLGSGGGSVFAVTRVRLKQICEIMTDTAVRNLPYHREDVSDEDHRPCSRACRSCRS